MRRGGTHFWQAPTALPTFPHRGERAQLKRHPSTHRLTNIKKNTREKIFRSLWRQEYSPCPQSHQPTLSGSHQKEAATKEGGLFEY